MKENRMPDTTRPSDEELVARVHAIGDIIARNSEAGDRDRRVQDESIAAMTEAGLFRLAVPRCYGGYQTSMKTLLDVTSAVGEYDGGTSWALTLINAVAWTMNLFPKEAQDEVWGENPDARISGVFAPSGRAVEEEGGFRISGKWFYNSGSWWSDWLMVAFSETDEGRGYANMYFALVPREDVEIEDTWFTAGMRASASNCIVAEDLFVPSYRIIQANDANAGIGFDQYADEDWLYRAAFGPLLILIIIGPQLGLGRAALKDALAIAPTRPVPGTPHAKQSESLPFQLRMAEAALKFTTAELHAYAAAEEIDRNAQNRVYPEIADRARITASAAYVAENVREGIDIVMTAIGASAFAESNRLQRIWRDSNTAGRHAFIAPDNRYEQYGKGLLGQDIFALV